MKILVTTGLYPPEIGGPATYTKMLESHLPAHGYEVTVLPFSSVRRLPKIIRHIAYFATCVSRARNADIIFALDPVSVGLPTMLAAKLLGKKFFLRLGGDYAWEQGKLRFGVADELEEFACANGRYPAMVRFFKRIQKYVASAAHRVTVQSEFMKRIVVCWGVPEEKIMVIPNGFDADYIASDRQSEKKALGLYGTIGVSAGRLVPWKGFSGIIEIVPEIITRIPDFMLYIIGDGPDEKKLQDMVVEKGLTEKVKCTGLLDKTDLMRYLTAADVFILNTEYEGFSNQLLEVSAAGTPVVTTDIDGNRELVEHGVSGLLVSPHDSTALKDAVLKVLEDKTFAEQLAAGGRKKLLEFSVERVMAATADFFHE